MSEKRCSRCARVLPIGMYANDISRRSGKSNACRECEAERHKRRDPQRNKPRVLDTAYYERKRRADAARRKRPDHNERMRARNTVGRAVRNGRIKRPETCEHCGGAPRRIEAHHRDYSKPLDVIWLCTSCHSAEHKREAVNAK